MATQGLSIELKTALADKQAGLKRADRAEAECRDLKGEVGWLRSENSRLEGCETELKAKIAQLAHDGQKRESQLLGSVAMLEAQIDALRKQLQPQAAAQKERVGDWL